MTQDHMVQKMYKKSIVIGAILGISVLMMACSVEPDIPDTQETVQSETQSETQEDRELYAIEKKEVVFSNVFFSFISIEPVEKNKFEYRFEISEFNEENDETLYAYIVDGHFRAEDKVKYVIKSALEHGLMVVEEYPYCSYNHKNERYPETGICVVVGTPHQLIELFDNTDPWKEGEEWKLVPAVRPDFPEILEQIGLKGNEVLGLGNKLDEIQAIIGTEPQSTLSVSVIVPNEE